jgi:hypothetical protein
MHGGRIWLASTGVHGEGSTFSFTLPVVSPKGKDGGHIEHNPTEHDSNAVEKVTGRRALNYSAEHDSDVRLRTSQSEIATATLEHGYQPSSFILDP